MNVMMVAGTALLALSATAKAQHSGAQHSAAQHPGAQHSGAGPRHVDVHRMSEITRTLASDEYQGRAPGTAGEERTIPYLIARFKAAGLAPAGEAGGWTQTVPMIRTQLHTPATVSFDQGGDHNALRFPDASILARCARSTASS